MQSDSKARLKYREVQKQLTQAKKNAQNKNSQYRPATISEIVNNINRTIKNQTQQYRDSDWSHYNNRSDELGYLAPGRFNAEKYNKPKVVFYFDVSGSWCYNKEKIAMGHRIEEALKNQTEPVTLGKRILRTETAGLTILSVLMVLLEGK